MYIFSRITWFQISSDDTFDFSEDDLNTETFVYIVENQIKENSVSNLVNLLYVQHSRLTNPLNWHF